MPVIGSNGRLSKWLGEYGTMFYRSEEVGDFVIHAFEPPVTGPTGVSLRFTRCSSYGLVQAYIDGEKTGGPVDFYSAGLEPMGGIADLGVLDLSEGRHEIKLEVVGRNDRANGCFIGVCDLVFTPVE